MLMHSRNVFLEIGFFFSVLLFTFVVAVVVGNITIWKPSKGTTRTRKQTICKAMNAHIKRGPGWYHTLIGKNKYNSMLQWKLNQSTNCEILNLVSRRENIRRFNGYSTTFLRGRWWLYTGCFYTFFYIVTIYSWGRLLDSSWNVRYFLFLTLSRVFNLKIQYDSTWMFIYFKKLWNY